MDRRTLPHCQADERGFENLRQTAPAKAQARGDLFYAAGPNEIARVARGPEGTFFTMGAQAPQWTTIDPITTAGDLIVGSATGTPERLAAGEDAQVLTTLNGALGWRTMRQPTMRAGRGSGGGGTLRNGDYGPYSEESQMQIIVPRSIPLSGQMQRIAFNSLNFVRIGGVVDGVTLRRTGRMLTVSGIRSSIFPGFILFIANANRGLA